MSSLSVQGSQFCLVGQLLGFVIKDGHKLKYLRMTVSEREYWIKVPKELRESLDSSIQPQCYLEIIGLGKVSRKTGKLELKAEEIRFISENEEPQKQPKILNATQKSKILICQKSDCWQRGGKQICQKLQQEIQDRGLSESVTIKTTGCLKQCKKAPNLVVLPDKAHYHRFTPQAVDQLLEKHFSS